MRKVAELSVDERKTLAAELQAFLKRSDAEHAAMAAAHNKLSADIEAQGRRFEAARIVKEARDGQYVPPNDRLVEAVALALGELPVETLNDEELAKLKNHHLAQLVVKKIVAHHGRPLRVDAEMLFARRFETILADEQRS